MTTTHEEHIEIENTALGERQSVVRATAPSTNTVFIARFTRIVWLLATIMAVVVAFRTILLLIGANMTSGFVEVIYSVTQPLVAPFAGIVADIQLGNGIFEPAGLFTIIIILLVAAVINTLVRTLFASPRAQRSVTTVERNTR